MISINEFSLFFFSVSDFEVCVANIRQMAAEGVVDPQVTWNQRWNDFTLIPTSGIDLLKTSVTFARKKKSVSLG